MSMGYFSKRVLKNLILIASIFPQDHPSAVDQEKLLSLWKPVGRHCVLNTALSNFKPFRKYTNSSVQNPKFFFESERPKF
jgi:hypothetical protein